MDVFISGVGTGGTITGVSRYIKKTKGKTIVSVAVEPSASPVLTQQRAGEPLKPGPHKIPGIGAGFIPKIWICHSWMTFSRSAMKRRYAMLAVLRAKRVSFPGSHVVPRWPRRYVMQSSENTGKTIVVILPDSGERYLSSILFEDVLTRRNHCNNGKDQAKPALAINRNKTGN